MAPSAPENASQTNLTRADNNFWLSVGPEMLELRNGLV